MRLDKYLSDTGKLTRKEAGTAVRRGRVSVNGKCIRDPGAHIDPGADVTLDMQPIVRSEFTYVLLDKPEGFISSTEKSDRTVMSLLPPEFAKMGMFPCGRLDRDTTGVLLVTNDGEMAHLLLSPRRHVSKTYRFTLTIPAADDTEERFHSGIVIGEDECAPAEVSFEPDRCSGTIILTEGKFHQVKRMFAAVGTEVVSLRRIKFGPLSEDGSPGPGQWRYLTHDEVASLAAAAGITRE